jgi:hypothetical protein
MRLLLLTILLVAMLAGGAGATNYWYAQYTTANIDSSGEWNSVAAGGGSVLTWASVGASDVLQANGKTINIDVASFTCMRISTAVENGSGAASGNFVDTAALTITGNVGSATDGSKCLTISGTGTALTVIGNLYGGSGTSAFGINSSGTNIVYTQIGNLYGGSGAGAAGFTGLGSVTTMSITGNITGGTSGSTTGLAVPDGCTATITNGTITGGAGWSSGQAITAGTGYVILNGCNLVTLYQGSQPINAYRMKFTPSSSNYVSFVDSTGTGTVYMALTPAPGNVRKTGSAYFVNSAGSYVDGLCVVPSAANVLTADSAGVAVGVDSAGGYGTATLPDSTGNAVLSSITSYGWGGNVLAGKYVGPSATGSTVLHGTSFGPSSSYAGNWYPPNVWDVWSLGGTLHYGVGGTSLTGSFITPTAAQVQATVPFGEGSGGSNTYTGSFTGGGGGPLVDGGYAR